MSGLPFMVRAMGPIRLVVLATTIVFAFIVLITNGHYISEELTSTQFIGRTKVWPVATADPFAAFALAVSVISLVVVNPMFIIDFFRQGAFTSLIVTELSVLGFLWLMWLITSAYTTSLFVHAAEACTNLSDISFVHSLCVNMQLSMAFGWLIWIFLTIYWVMLITMAIIASKKGKPVWKSPVQGNDFGYYEKMSAKAGSAGMQSNERIIMEKQGGMDTMPVNNLSYSFPQADLSGVSAYPPAPQL